MTYLKTRIVILNAAKNLSFLPARPFPIRLAYGSLRVRVTGFDIILLC
jgi:hypothetical protein